jgi:hypothetical protein
MHRNTQTQNKQTCSSTQMFALCGNRTRDLLRSRRVVSLLRQIGCQTLFYTMLWWLSFWHRISIPAYAIEQQCWQSGVPKNEMSLMSLMFKNCAFWIAKPVTMWHYFKNYWHAIKWSSISFSHWQCPSDGDFSFPRFVGLLILSLCVFVLELW